MFVQAFGGRIVEPSARSRGDHDPERRDQNFDTHSYTEAASVGGLFRNFEPQMRCSLLALQRHGGRVSTDLGNRLPVAIVTLKESNAQPQGQGNPRR